MTRGVARLDEDPTQASTLRVRGRARRSGGEIADLRSAALSETGIDERPGSELIPHGKGEKRREAGMERFGFEQFGAGLTHRVSLPPGTSFCVIGGSIRGGRWAPTASRAELPGPAKGSSPPRPPTPSNLPRQIPSG